VTAGVSHAAIRTADILISQGDARPAGFARKVDSARKVGNLHVKSIM
jgi:hypothetical protein